MSGARIDLVADTGEAGARVLTPEALAFVAELHCTFNPIRLELLAARADRQQRLASGELPDFLEDTHATRPPEGRDRDPAGAAARLALARESLAGRRRADLGQPVRLRPLPVSLRPAPMRCRLRSVLLSPQARVASRGATVERRLSPRPGATFAPARDDPGHRADRDHPGRLRDGRDSPR